MPEQHTGTSAPLNDELLMLLMAFADGELSNEESANVQSLLKRSAEARSLIGDLRLAQRALHDDLMHAQDVPQEIVGLDNLRDRVLADVSALQLMAHVDGELIGEAAQAAGIEDLMAESEDARALVHDLQWSRQALRQEILSDETEADLSMVRGRIITRLPAEARPAVKVEDDSSDFMERLRALLFGRAGLTVGMAAAAVLMVLALGQMQDRVPVDNSAESEYAVQLAPPADGEPFVIIEEMEIDSGTVLVDNGEEAGAATIIWHYQDDEDEGAG